MVVSSLEVFTLIMLLVGVAVAAWIYVVKVKNINTLKQNVYTRGANIKGGGNSTKLTCGIDHTIKVYKAAQICSNPDSNNFEDPTTDPISGGTDGTVGYGVWDPATTVDLTDTMGKSVNGKQTVTYTFTPEAFPNGMVCPSESTQLIATYDCVPA